MHRPYPLTGLGSLHGRLAAVLCGLLLSAGSAAQEPARADTAVDHAWQGGVLTVVARGQPGALPESLSKALEERLSTLCARPQALEPRETSTYRHLGSAAHEPAPKDTLFFPTQHFSVVKWAPSLVQRLRCAEPAGVEETPRIRVSIDNRLGDSLRFADIRSLGPHRKLELPMRGPPAQEQLAQAVRDAFAARGQGVEMVAAEQTHDLRVVIKPAQVPGEYLAGQVLATKTGAFGRAKVSIAFSSIEVGLYRTRPSPLQAVVQVNTFLGLPLLYENWDREMAGGPSPDLQERSSAVVQTMRADNVQAAVLAVSPQLMQQLLVAALP